MTKTIVALRDWLNRQRRPLLKAVLSSLLAAAFLSVTFYSLQNISQAAPAPQTITSTPLWQQLSTAGDGTGTVNASGVDNQLQAICEFTGLRLNGDRSEKLEVLLEDDFSNLSGHYFVVEGYTE